MPSCYQPLVHAVRTKPGSGYRGTVNPRPHVIFTNGRSGSNYVANLLNAHPHVTNYGEVMGEFSPAYKAHERLKVWGRNIEEYLDTVLTSRSYFEAAQVFSAAQRLRRRQRPNWKRWSTTESVGFKEFGIRFERRGLDDFLATRPHIPVISLVRENTFDRVVSVHRMAQTNEIAAAHSHGSGSDRSISIPIDVMLGDLEVYEEEKAYQLSIVDGLDSARVLHITYEDLFASGEAQSTFRTELFDLVGVRDADVASSHRRISDRPIEDRLANYGEIREAVKATPFACYLPA